MNTEYFLNFKSNDLDNFNKPQLEEFYKWLIDIIKYHNNLYYNQDSSIITDWEYDKLFDLLLYFENLHPDLLSPNSPTQSIQDQFDTQTEFAKAQHDTPLLSLQKSYDEAGLLDRDESNTKTLAKLWILWPDQNIQYLIEPKFDWVSVELIYIDGVFTQAITRWDGSIWEDITINVMTIPSIPRKLIWNHTGKKRFRWEIMMTKTEFDRINLEKASNWEALFANPRNAASWSVKQLDPNITASRNLICYIYEEL